MRDPAYEPPAPPTFDASPWRAAQDDHDCWCVERVLVEDHHTGQGWLACTIQRVYPTISEGCTTERAEARAHEVALALRRIYQT